MKIAERIKGIVSFVKKDIWSFPVEQLSKPQQILIKLVKIILLTQQGFMKDNCQVRASALTFFSMLSIVPVLALVFGIAQGFGLEKVIINMVNENLKGQEEVAKYAVDFAYKLLDTTKGSMVAGIGIVVLVWSVMKLMISIEESFNVMYKVKKGRSLVRKLTDYLSITIFAPILLVLSSSSTVFLTTVLSKHVQNPELLQYASGFMSLMFKMLPYVLIWVVMTLIYIIMPNTKVNIKAAIIAGILAGTVFQITQWGYITFQIGVGRYNAIYGSFAALPLFLFWLQTSWLIVLGGGEMAYAIQNIDKYGVEYEHEAIQFSNDYKRQLALLILHLTVKRFAKGERAATLAEITEQLKIPQNFAKKIIGELIESKLLTETKTDEEHVYGYQPAIDINQITIGYVLTSLDKRGWNGIKIAENHETKVFNKCLSDFRKLISNSTDNKLIKDI